MAVSQKSRQDYLECRRLLGVAGDAHYRRVILARNLLADREWVDSEIDGGGDELTALRRLERNCFADITAQGYLSLSQLLQVLAVYPNQKSWEAAKYDLRLLWAQVNATKKPEKKRHYHPKVTPPIAAPFEFEELPPSKQRATYERAYRKIETDTEKIERLEAEKAALLEENAHLREENATLKAELAQFRKDVG